MSHHHNSSALGSGGAGHPPNLPYHLHTLQMHHQQQQQQQQHQQHQQQQLQQQQLHHQEQQQRQQQQLQQHIQIHHQSRPRIPLSSEHMGRGSPHLDLSPGHPHRLSQPDPHRLSQSDSHRLSQPDPHRLSQPDSHRLSQPDSHRLSQPDAHRLSQADVHRLSHPDAHRLSQPDAHRLSQPDAHRLSQPDAHRLSQPDAHRLSQPDAHRLSQPDAHRLSQPDVHRHSQPDAHRLSQSDAHRLSQADAHRLSQPDAHRLSQPDAHRLSQPDAHRLSQPDAHRLSQPDAHRLSQQLDSQATRPVRIYSMNKSPSGVPSPANEMMWRHPNPSRYHAPQNIHPGYPPDDPARESRQEDARRAQEQVMKHFEESFRYAQQKSTPQGYLPLPKAEDLKPVGGRSVIMGAQPSPSPPNKGVYHTSPYASPCPPSPYHDVHALTKNPIPGTPNVEFMYGERPFYSQGQGAVASGRPRESSASKGREMERQSVSSSPNHVGKTNYPYMPAPSNRVKVSSPAPPQIYGKPSIPASCSPSSRMSLYDLHSESAPLSLTSKVSTRPTHTPPLPSVTSVSNLPKHEVRSADLASFYMYNPQNGPSYNHSAGQGIPKLEYQTQPLDLGGKRKLETKPFESEIKKLKNEDNKTPVTLPISIPVSPDMEVLDLKSKKPITPAPLPDENMNGLPISIPCSAAGTGVISVERDVPQLPSAIVASTPRDPSPNPEMILPSSPARPASTSSTPTKVGTSVHKLKKAWLQRHSGQDCVSPAEAGDEGPVLAPVIPSLEPADVNTVVGPTANDSPELSNNGVVNSAATPESFLSQNSPLQQARKKTENRARSSQANGHDESLKITPSSSDSDTESKKNQPKRPRPKGKKKATGKEQKPKAGSDTMSESEKDSGLSDESVKEGSSKEQEQQSSSPVKKRGRKPREPGTITSKGDRKKSNPFKRPPIVYLKRTGDSFLQDGPCSDVAAKLGKCRECRWSSGIRSKDKKHTNIFCRFYAFRKLRYTKNGVLAISGFSDPTNDPSQDDVNLWLPSNTTEPKALELDMAKFLIEQLGDQFCELIQQEKEAIEVNMSQTPGLVAWKRVVQGVREMCDVCDTTLFNFHWACGKCGFVVCIACYKGRKQGIIKNINETGKERDDFQWLFCSNRQAHEIEKLVLTQAVAGDALTTLGKLMHKTRVAWKIVQNCDCEEVRVHKAINRESEVEANGKEPTKQDNLIQLPETDMEIETTDALTPTPMPIQEEEKILDPPKITKQETPKGNASDDSEDSDDGDSALTGLLGGSTSTVVEENESSVPVPVPVPVTSKPDPTTPPPRNTLVETPKNVENSQESPEPEPEKPKCKEVELKHFIRRTEGSLLDRREKEKPSVLPQSQSSKLFPGVPHSWLCFGKLLHLHDPLHDGNQKIFQEVWKRGQPVLVSHVSDKLNKSLWSPDSFSKDFGDLKNDLVNCMTGRLLSNQPMKRFWDGFEHVNKRLKDDKGNPMLLKLKDWPPGEDFAEMLPSRFKDLMACLPLKEYTNRDGRLNLAARLPDNFVKPDLGPKMYIAYGSGAHLDKGTTNLHLDISDAVNLMVYVGVPKDCDNSDHHKAVHEAVDQSDCDGLTMDRIREGGELPGALWHIYNARDADKIRDLLNKVALERGVALEAHHDPIHDQSWYLDRNLRQRLVEEYDVMGYPIVQFMGDAVFIPAGAPHQVRNLQNCIKIAEDFVSPENVSHCFHLTEEFRNLSETHSNHEDKLQIKNIIYHAVKDAISVLRFSLLQDTVSKEEEQTESEGLVTSVASNNAENVLVVPEEPLNKD